MMITSAAAAPQASEATLQTPASIHVVDKDTVHRICSGQVVLTLSTAVKELVENSLDAGAKNIDIQLVQHGAESIQVADDGCGITEDNFKALTLKHHTSKLTNFSDLTALDTFGFRGEALSSLCALSTLSVTTRHASSVSGTTLKYGHGGELLTTESAPRPIGTTILLEELFAPLPVRRREFERNVKREFAKMLHILQAYCLVSAGVRISVWNDTGRGRKQVLSTRGARGLTEAITDVFGRKQMLSLVGIQQCVPTEEDLQMHNLPEGTDCGNIKISGFISSCVHGQGRSSADRQYYFINGRPCDPSRLTKLVNELYRSHNRHQTPFVCLLVSTASEQVDVNVTPDKRQILLEQEKLLLAKVRSSLRKTFERMPASYEVNMSWASDGNRSSQGSDSSGAAATVESVLETSTNSIRSLRERFAIGAAGDQPAQIEIKKAASEKSGKQVKEASSSSLSLKLQPSIQHIFAPSHHQGNKAATERLNEVESMDTECSRDQEVQERVEYVIDHEDHPRARRREKKLVFSMNRLKKPKLKWGTEKGANSYRKFLSKIDPSENSTAEAELVKHLSKSDFPRMCPVGQFNLGFIIGRLDNDLFLIDQHASDEKFNFERLQQLQLLEGQTMVVPQQMDLSLANEELLRDHLDVFHRNGFHFEFNKDGVRLKRVPQYRDWLFGKSDVEELLFMLSESSSDSTSHLRPSRVRSMFASRACRTSVMIGTALSRGEMRRMIANMAGMDQPWNCPHGRPTIRHLINLNMVKKR